MGKSDDVTTLTFNMDSTERVPSAVDPETGETLFMKLHAMCMDSRGRSWIAASRLRDYEGLKRVGFHDFQPGFDREHEFLEENKTTYVPLDNVRGFGWVLECGKSEYAAKRMSATLPKGGLQCGFTRGGYCGKTLRLLAAAAA